MHVFADELNSKEEEKRVMEVTSCASFLARRAL